MTRTPPKRSAITLINNKINSLSKSERQVARYIQQHPDEVIVLSLQNIAQRCETSDATVLRFCRSLGYAGYQDFKLALVPELLQKGFRLHQNIEPMDDGDTKKQKFIENLQTQLEHTIGNCDFGLLQEAARNMVNANRIMIVGIGGSAGVAQILCDSLGGVGIVSQSLNDRSVIESLVTLVGPGDLVICISHSGETHEAVFSARQAKANGAQTIAITNFLGSPLESIADLTILTSTVENILGSYSCNPRISQLALVELILHQITEELGGQAGNSTAAAVH